MIVCPNYVYDFRPQMVLYRCTNIMVHVREFLANINWNILDDDKILVVMNSLRNKMNYDIWIKYSLAI